MSKLNLLLRAILVVGAITPLVVCCSTSYAQGIGAFDMDSIMKSGGSSSKDILGKPNKSMSFRSSSTKSSYSTKPKDHSYKVDKKYASAPKPGTEVRKFSKAARNATSTSQVDAFLTSRVKKNFNQNNVKYWRDVFRSVVRFDDTTYKNDTAYVYVYRKKPSSMAYHKGRFVMKYENGRWKVDSYRDTHWFNRIPN